MAKAQRKPKQDKPRNEGAYVLGRSALTGQFVFKPASSKGATITQRQAAAAVLSLYESRAAR